MANVQVDALWYVHRHGRVLSAGVAPSLWDTSLVGQAELVSPWPTVLEESDDWRGGGEWRDWLTEPKPGDHRDADVVRYVSPYDRGAVKMPFLLSRSTVTFLLPIDGLPQLPNELPDDNSLVELVRRAVAELVCEMNRVVAPILERLQTG
ncbi:hypothetical protein [Actinomadura opuntiae]|uniref:hypothetical protein n=1 Tax=Actinomadura sp. OS1-43 TaxID=604315 RepID=UPI00255B3E99|nr:hypothetical protein [Actinomadura sp. OS1-43]MDL4819308.1 hypothetical protein [Actinomadura sp. OS1-43]